MSPTVSTVPTVGDGAAVRRFPWKIWSLLTALVMLGAVVVALTSAPAARAAVDEFPSTGDGGGCECDPDPVPPETVFVPTTETVYVPTTETEYLPTTETQYVPTTETVYEKGEPYAVTETTTVATTLTDTATIPTTVDHTVDRDVPTTIEHAVDHTELSTIVQAQPGPTSYFAQYVTENVTQTETALSTSTAYDQVQVSWALATTVNPATGRIPAVTVSQSQVAPGDSIRVSVDGFSPGEQVRIELHSTPVLLGTVTAGADGTANSTVTIPADTEAGQHMITVVGVTCGIQAAIPITVVAAAAEAPVASLAAFDPQGRSLSYTGVDTGWAVSLAAALLVGGFALVWLGRRRATAGGLHLVTDEPPAPGGRHRA
jgi:hypothetical protein